MLIAIQLSSGSCHPSLSTSSNNHTQHNKSSDPDHSDSGSYIQDLRSRIQDSGSCERISVCFALDGSGSISATGYSLQIKFAETIAGIVGVNPSNQFAAVQYGLRNVEISPLTHDMGAFRTSLKSSKSSQAPRTFVAAGIGGCAVKLRGKSTSVGNGLKSNGTHHGMSTMKRLERSGRKIVLLGDGQSNFGISPVQVASIVEKEIGADLFAIGIGFPDVIELKEIVGDANKFTSVGRYEELEMRQVVSDVVSFACGTEKE